MDQTIIERLPLEWQGLFECFLFSVDRAALWYMGATQSQYGHNPMWQTLLESLTKMDPCIEGKQLIFKPRILLLSPRLQQSFLAFLIGESYIVADTDIATFVQKAVQHMERDKCREVYELLAELYKQTKFGCEVELFCGKDKQTDNSDPVDDQHVTKVTSSDNNANVETVSQPNLIILDDDDEEICGPVLKRQRMESPAVMEVNSENLDLEISNMVDLKDIQIENKAKEGEKPDNAICDFLRGKGEIIDKIKDFWHNGVKDSASPGEIEDILKCSAMEMEAFCKCVDFTSMSDNSIETVCQHMCNISDTLSYDSVVCLLTFALCDRVKHLSQNASRKLSGAVTLVAERFPKQLIESVLVPCFCQDTVLPSQGELLCRVIKESLNNLTRSYLIQKLLVPDFIDVNESKIAVFQTVLENGCNISDETFVKLLDVLYSSSLTLGKNLRFGKLLLALVNKHGKLVTFENKQKFESILSQHNTF